MMRSVRVQLAVTLLAIVVAAAVMVVKGPVPAISMTEAIRIRDMAKAVEVRSEAQIERCLRWGVDPDRPAWHSNTGLHYAATMGDVWLTELLLRYGAATELRDQNDETPLILAARKYDYHFDRPARDLPMNPTDAEREAYELEACRLWREWSSHTAVARLLLDHGADPNARRHGNTTAMYEAIHKGHLGMVKFLLENGVDANAECIERRSPLRLAASGNAVHLPAYLDTRTKAADEYARQSLRDLVAMLVAHGADLEAKDADGFTPLHTALICGSARGAEALLLAGADANARNAKGETPLYLCVRRSLRELDGEVDLFGDGHESSIALPRLLVKHGADVSARTNSGETILAAAIKERDMQLRQFLSDRGARE